MQDRLQLGWAVLCFVMCAGRTYFAVELPNLMSHIATHWIAAIAVVPWLDHRWYWCHCHPQQSTYSDSAVDNPFCSRNTVCPLTIWPAIKSDSLSGLEQRSDGWIVNWECLGNLFFSAQVQKHTQSLARTTLCKWTIDEKKATIGRKTTRIHSIVKYVCIVYSRKCVYLRFRFFFSSDSQRCCVSPYVITFTFTLGYLTTYEQKATNPNNIK